MRTLQILILVLLVVALPTSLLAAPKMRPYSGIGVLKLSEIGLTDAIPLYDDPGIARCCKLPYAVLKNLNSWLFGQAESSFLLVTARKSDWLEVEHDDAGRTGWIKPERRWNYLPWEQFLKGKQVAFLRNSPKNQMQVVSHPGAAAGIPLTTKQSMKAILAQGDWLYVLIDQSSAGWIRWRDSDGRLLIGFDT